MASVGSTKMGKKLHSMALEFLASRKNANHLADIISLFESNDAHIQPCILAMEIIFLEVLRRGDMRPDATHSGPPDLEAQYIAWLRQCYEDLWKKLVSLITHSSHLAVQAQSLSTAMKVIAMEGQHPIDPVKSNNHYFPLHRFKPIVLALTSSSRNTSHLLLRIQEFNIYPDVLVNLWRMLVPIATSFLRNGQRPNEIFIRNFLDVLDKFPLPRPGRAQIVVQEPLCGKQGHNSYHLSMDFLRKSVNKVWGCVMNWDLTPSTQRLMLVVLLENVLPFLERPLYFTDYFMDCLDMGGAVSLLALQGLFTLIQDYNLEYPNIFNKLYSMFEPEIFHTKYKARLFYLADLFLSSTHLPECIVAAFAKRLARLSLVAPPSDANIILMFIGNLILRHPGLKRLIQHPSGGDVCGDPFIMEEGDPSKSRAMESSLWELQSLQSHILPGVAQAAMFIYNPLPSVEWDLSKILEENCDDIFEKEMKKKLKELAQTFNRPYNLALPHHEKVSHYWHMM